MNKKLIILIIWLCVLWVVHVVQLNKRYDETTKVCGMGESIYVESLEVQAVDAVLCTATEYEAMTNEQYEDMNSECYVLMVTLQVKNLTDENMSWDTLLDSLGYGFESKTWWSSVVPGLTTVYNVFSSDAFYAGSTQRISLATQIEKVCFREKTWRHIDDETFYFVLDIYPDAKRIRLDIE